MRKKIVSILVFGLLIILIVSIFNSFFIIQIPFTDKKIPRYFFFGYIGLDIDETLSPDGVYFIDYNQTIHHTDKISKNLKFHVDAEYLNRFSWSPDSKAFVVSASGTVGKCVDDRLYLVDLEDEENIKVREYHLDSLNCGYVTWSPDGSQILIPHGKEPIIINRFAQENTQPKKLSIDYRCSSTVVWTEERIICVNKGEEPNELTTDFQLIYLDPDNYSVEISQIYSFYILSVSPDDSKLLSRNLDEEYSYEIWDIESSKVIKTIKVDWIIKSASPIQNDGKVSFIGGIKNGTIDDNHIYIFDWETMEFTDFGKANWVAGWRSEMGGALVMKKVFWFSGAVPFVSVNIVP